MQKGYEWLRRETGPKILLEAIQLLGTTEAPGSANNAAILRWAKELGVSRLGIVYNKDEIPWCGLFVGICALRAGFEPPAICVRALSWAGFGTPVKDPMLGDILTFTRKGGGHVGLYVGEDSKAFHVLGGNQGDSANIKRIAKERLYASSRCPWKIKQPYNVRRVWLSPLGAMSNNEA